MTALDETIGSLEELYESALQDYLHNEDESQLSVAYEVGREAMRTGHSLVDLVDMHYQAWLQFLRGRKDVPPTLVDTAQASRKFFLQSASSFHVLQMGSRESIAAMRRLNELFEKEANRIAHDLHDDATQLLAVVYLELSMLRAEGSESIQTRVDRITQYLDETCEQLRRISHELRPPMLAQRGLFPALEYMVSGFRQRNGLLVTLETPKTALRLPADIESTLYRVVQEALRNTVRHAKATHAEVSIHVSGRNVTCLIRDDGIGFDPGKSDPPDDQGLGLIGIRERVGALQGSLSIHAAPAHGTELHIAIPLAE